MGAIDIVCNLFTQRERFEKVIQASMTTFWSSFTFLRYATGYPLELRKMDRAGVEHSLLIAVRTSNMLR